MGTLYAWGDNRGGQLGNGSLTSTHIPTPVDMTGVLAGKEVVDIAVIGMNETYMAVTRDGLMYTWGYGTTHGQLGNGILGNSSVPVAVDTSGISPSPKVVEVFGGTQSMTWLARTDDGRLINWGYGLQGQLGHGRFGNESKPVAVNTSGVLAGKQITSVATSVGSNGAVFALTSDGQAFSWGYNSYGLLGNGSTTDSSIPVAVNMSGVLAGKTITKLVAGSTSNHAIALASDGKLYAWGEGYYGQMGNGTSGNPGIRNPLPAAVDMTGVLAGKTIEDVQIAWNTTLVIADGQAYSWGTYTGTPGPRVT
ncbi:RCC1 domain-containing protein [Leucobacter coleopterorum]|nr:hypothetical protein [Leucobacter coleopterorum]